MCSGPSRTLKAENQHVLWSFQASESRKLTHTSLELRSESQTEPNCPTCTFLLFNFRAYKLQMKTSILSQTEIHVHSFYISNKKIKRLQFDLKE